jgi:hypothetical protein
MAEAQCLRVWRRSEVCEALGISEAAFVHFAIAIGNDYTASFDRAVAYDWSLLKHAETHGAPARGVSSGFGVAALDSLLVTVAGLEGPLRACAATESPEQAAAVQLAIDYSIAVYELHPLDGFPLDDPVSTRLCESDESPQQQEVAFAAKDGFVSPAEVMWRFRSCGNSAPGTEPPAPEGEELALATAAALDESAEDSPFFQDLQAYVAEQVAAAAGPPRPRKGVAEHALCYLRGKGAPELSAAHLQGIEAMLQRLNERSQAPVEAFPYRPRWRDVVAAHAYQRACYLLLRHLPLDVYRNKRNGPTDLYHGIYFHSALRSIACAAAPVPGIAAPAPAQSALTPAPTVAEDAALKSTAVAPEPARPEPAAEVPGRKETLPIDAYREEILARIQRDRVTIIHGETGCGKSSCLPAFLLEHAESCNPPQPCQIMVSQPRRIAVTSLLRRLRQTLGHKVGMRMGHGVRDDSPATRIHYVTTGYLVRALAHQPQHFLKVTHLIIDEVHERSVDGDLVCLLARDLLR